MRELTTRLFIGLFLFPLAFDFKTEPEAGHGLQIALAICALSGGIYLALIAPHFKQNFPFKSLVTAAIVATVGGGVITELIQRNDVGNFFRVFLPFAIFLISFKVGCHPWSPARRLKLEAAMFWSMVASVLFTFLYGITLPDVGFAEVRYQIVSPVLIGLQAFVFNDIFINRKTTKTGVFIIFLTLLIEFFSVTRSLIIGTALLFFLAKWLGSPNKFNIIKPILHAAVIAAGLAVALVATESVFPGVTEHWVQRIFIGEKTQRNWDPTTLTRVAELRDQYDQLTSSTASLLIGEGFGHDFGLSPKYYYDIKEIPSLKGAESHKSWQAGHNFWMYQLFSGGILFGTALPISLLYTMYRCIRSFGRWRRFYPKDENWLVMSRHIMIMAGMIVTTIGGNPLGVRFSGVIFGLSFGLLVAAHCEWRRIVRTTNHSAPITMRITENHGHFS